MDQRRGRIEQQPLLTIKVELEQLIISISVRKPCFFLGQLFRHSLSFSSSLSSSSLSCHITRVTIVPVKYAPSTPDSNFYRELSHLKSLRSRLADSHSCHQLTVEVTETSSTETNVIGKKKISVAGATGNTGKRIVEQLLAKGFSFKTRVRNLEKAKASLPSNNLALQIVMVDVADGSAQLVEVISIDSEALQKFPKILSLSIVSIHPIPWPSPMVPLRELQTLRTALRRSSASSHWVLVGTCCRVHFSSEKAEILDDGYRWRKYGKKTVNILITTDTKVLTVRAVADPNPISCEYHEH